MSSRNEVLVHVFCSGACCRNLSTKNRECFLQFLGITMAFFSCLLSTSFEHEHLDQIVENRNSTIKGLDMENLRNNYSFVVYIICACLSSVFNYFLPFNYVVIGICILNFVHGVCAPYFQEEHVKTFIFLQFAYAISTSTCWIIVSRIKSPEGSPMEKNLYKMFCFFVFQAISMIDMSIFCRAVHTPIKSENNCTRVILAFLRIVINFYLMWPSNENEEPQIHVETNISKLQKERKVNEESRHQHWWKVNWRKVNWNRTLFSVFRKLHAVAYNAYWNCLFPFRFSSIGYSNDDNFMKSISFASALGVVLGVLVIELLIISKGPVSRQKVVILSTILIIASYLIALLFFDDVTLEGLKLNGDKKFWLGMFCKFLNGLGSSCCYAIVMAFSSTLPDGPSVLSITLSNVFANIFFYIPLFRYQRYISAFSKFLILSITTFGMSYYYLVVEKEQTVKESNKTDEEQPMNA